MTIRVAPWSVFRNLIRFIDQQNGDVYSGNRCTASFPLHSSNVSAVLITSLHQSYSPRVYKYVYLRCNTRWFKYDRDDLCVNSV
jgi:hypothetical protein